MDEQQRQLTDRQIDEGRGIVRPSSAYGPDGMYLQETPQTSFGSGYTPQTWYDYSQWSHNAIPQVNGIDPYSGQDLNALPQYGNPSFYQYGGNMYMASPSLWEGILNSTSDWQGAPNYVQPGAGGMPTNYGLGEGSSLGYANPGYGYGYSI